MKIGMISALAAAAMAVAGCDNGNVANAGEAKDAASQYGEVKNAATQQAPKNEEAAPEAASASAAAPAPAAVPAPVPAKAEDPNEVMVSVNGKTLTRGAIAGDVAKILEAYKAQIPPEQLEAAKSHFGEQLASQFLMKTILLDEAAKKGVKLTDDFRKKQEAEFVKSVAGRPGAPKSFAEMAEKHPLGKERGLRDVEDELTIRMLFEREVTGKIKVDPKRVAEVFQNATSNYQASAAKAQGAEAKIKALAKQLEGLKGDALAKKFAELAKANSDCPSKEKGGDLGEFTHGQMVKEFDEVAFKSAPFTVSAPVKTQFGWHLIMVTKKIAAVPAQGDKPASPEKVQASHILIGAKMPPKAPTKEDIEKGMKRQEEQMATRKYVEGLRAAAKIEAPGYPNLQPKPQPKPVVSKPIESKPVEVKPAAPAAKPAAPAAKPAAPAAKPAAPAAKPAAPAAKK